MAVGAAVALVLVIILADVISPKGVYLSPMLVVAPALTTAFAGPRLTAGVALVAIAAQMVAASLTGSALSAARLWQLSALVVVSILLIFFSYVRQRRARQLSRARRVAEAAQRVLLRPPPERVGPLRIGWQYLTAEDDTQFGGDLFAVTRRRPDSSRVIIGDVRGHGLPAISEASAALGSFREAARRCARLDELALILEESIGWDLEEGGEGPGQEDEHFVTALLLDLPDAHDHASMISCGHSPPLLVHSDGRVTTAHCDPAPPLGLGYLSLTGVRIQTVEYAVGDTLLLYTDGVIEARSPQGEFYPLAKRVRSFPYSESPEVLLKRLRQDLLAHTGGHLSDDAALLAVTRAN
ncbi:MULTISPECIES: PP2C family protein-serine/threonine phosphatase [Streptomyces]|nr:MULTISPECIES: PP2C family protein-serine/threonine phosphatase [Streptomyces]MDX2928646.1 PP2C family protein-serine/threonine phosphatase [Streptomyces sp. NRRL_B-16638]MDX3350519.1 PP2C family protein-serine/threonine phosphatase [Streptomyces sp. ME02-6979A]NSL81188.1 serine/threonine-protein phosphatase [Streptomyces coelicolor]QKN69726.1 serine/threonine-protein phosphatase [Streptomyces coelicolor]TYP02465.1 serine phosphatase RsbU (regulator of sigma subunit) [Streptomyces coelicolor